MGNNSRIEGVLPLLGALVVIASASIQPGETLAISVGVLILLSLYFFLRKRT